MPELQALADDVGATSALTLRDGSHAVVAAVCEPRSSDIHIAYRAGLRHRLDQAASGIAILAALPAQAGEREAIAQARERGWSHSAGELLAGATGVAAAVTDPEGGVQASVSIAGSRIATRRRWPNVCSRRPRASRRLCGEARRVRPSTSDPV